MAVAAGLLFAAIAVPTVAGIGVLTKTAISKFDHMAVPKLGLLPVRSEIYDRKGHLITYYYPNGIDRVPVTYSQISPSMRMAGKAGGSAPEAITWSMPSRSRTPSR